MLSTVSSIEPFAYSSFPLVRLSQKRKEKFKGRTIFTAQQSLAYILSMIIIILAVSLSWQCHRGSCMIGRIIHAFLAACFSFWYLTFYVIYRILLGNKCQK